MSQVIRRAYRQRYVEGKKKLRLLIWTVCHIGMVLEFHFRFANNTLIINNEDYYNNNNYQSDTLVCRTHRSLGISLL